MVTHKQLRMITLVLLVIVISMITADLLWLDTVKSIKFSLLYWGLCAFLAVALIILALADLRYLKVKYLFQEQHLFKQTMTDEEFVRQLKEKAESEESGSDQETGQAESNDAQSTQ